MSDHDCGHACCDTPGDPFHDHFLDPEDCCIGRDDEEKHERA